jgi:hypothetical protein
MVVSKENLTRVAWARYVGVHRCEECNSWYRRLGHSLTGSMGVSLIGRLLRRWDREPSGPIGQARAGAMAAECSAQAGDHRRAVPVRAG